MVLILGLVVRFSLGTQFVCFAKSSSIKSVQVDVRGKKPLASASINLASIFFFFGGGGDFIKLFCGKRGASKPYEHVSLYLQTGIM